MSSFKQNMTSPPQGMLLITFLVKNYDWSQESHLYIVEQIPQILENPAMRCGVAGTALYKDADAPSRSSESSQKGLQCRLSHDTVQQLLFAKHRQDPRVFTNAKAICGTIIPKDCRR